MRRVARWLCAPQRQRRIHGTKLIMAIVLSVPIMVFTRDSVPILMAVSLWTWIDGNAAPWLAAMAADNDDEEPCT